MLIHTQVPVAQLLVLPAQIKHLFHFLAVVGEAPFFRVMICVEHRDNKLTHVPCFRARQICGIKKVEADGLAVGRSAGCHARLVSGTAVVRHQ